MTAARLALVSLVLVAGCRERRLAAVLEDLARDVAVPGYQEVATRSDQLVVAVDRLAAAPDAAALASAQQRWRDAIVAWKQVFAFRQGGLIAAAPHFRATYAPTEPRKLAEALAAGAAPVDAAFVRDLGVSAKGMFALERLLFGGRGEGEPLAALTAAGSERRRALARALAADVAAHATAAARTTTSPVFAAELGRGGQASLNRLVNDLAAVVEQIVTSRLELVLGAREAGTLASNPVEGQASRSSQAITLALLRGVAQVYRGGLGALVRARGRGADEATEAALVRALAAVEALGAPIEEVVVAQRDAVAKASADVRALEVALKTQVAGTLGVTLTFSAGDGD